MTITISNLTISNNVSAGSVIGVLTAWDASGNIIPCNFTLTKGSVGYFAIIGEQLVTAWSLPAVPGYYSVRVRAIGSGGGFSGSARFAVNIVMAAPPPPPPLPIPVSVNLTPATASLPDNSPTGTQVCSVAVNMSDGSPFAGQISINPGNMIGMSGSNCVLTRGLVSTDDGADSFGVTATQNTVSAQATLTVNVVAVAPPPPPPGSHIVNIGLAEDAYQGDAQYSIAVDGSIVIADGTVTVLNSSGNSQDVAITVSDGPHTIAVTFLNDAYGGTPALDRNLYVIYVKYDGVVIAGSQAALFSTGDSLVVTVGSGAAPPPPPLPTPVSVNLTPTTVSLPDNSPTGTQVCSVAVNMSDGSPFAGQISINPGNMIGMSGSNCVLTRGLASTDDGADSFGITATENGSSADATLAVNVVSADGSSITTSSGGSLTTLNGTWTFDPNNQMFGGQGINLNGVYSGGYGIELEVANGGKIYTLTAPGGGNNWWVYASGNWTLSSDPTSPAQPPPPPLPIPVSVSLTPATVSLSDNSPTGTQVCSVAVNMSDGSPFAGQISINPGNMIGLSGSNCVLTRGLASTDDGADSFGITATQNTVSAQATLKVNVAAVAPPPPPPPPGVVMTVNGANGATTAPPGSSLTISVSSGPANQLDWVAIAPAGSDGRTFGAWCYLNGTQTPPPTGLAQATVTLPAPTVVGAYEVRFLPNNLYMVTASVELSVAAGPVITVTPSTPMVPDTTAKGAVVAAYTVAMSDGSAFTGTIGFGAPNFDAGGIFALTGTNTSGQVIVNPSGPGVGPNMTTITDNITLEAIP